MTTKAKTAEQRLAAIRRLFRTKKLPLHRSESWRTCGCDDCEMDRKIYELTEPTESKKRAAKARKR